jgi:hypothetical protein
LNIQKIRNIKDFIKDLQFNQLDIISDFILEGTGIMMHDLRGISRKKELTEYKRKIAFIARISYNINGDSLVSYLKVSKPQVSDYIYSAYERCRQDTDYLQSVREIMIKLVVYHNDNLRPSI